MLKGFGIVYVCVFISADALPTPRKEAIVFPPSPQSPPASPVSTLGKCIQHDCSRNVHHAVKLKGKPHECKESHMNAKDSPRCIASYY